MSFTVEDTGLERMSDLPQFTPFTNSRAWLPSSPIYFTVLFGSISQNFNCEGTYSIISLPCTRSINVDQIALGPLVESVLWLFVSIHLEIIPLKLRIA